MPLAWIAAVHDSGRTPIPLISRLPQPRGGPLSRIAAIVTHPVVVPLSRPRRTAHEPLTESSLLLVEVRTDDGLTGYGQVTSTPLRAVADWIGRLAEHAIGLDARAPVAAREKL